jgi:hypothetical protein
MIAVRRKELESEFTKKYTLSKSDFQRMIREKMERASLYAKIQERKNSKEFA